MRRAAGRGRRPRVPPRPRGRCSSFIDNAGHLAHLIDNAGHLAHLQARDPSFVVVSDMPMAQIVAYRQRMGWTVPFVSSHGTSFSADCGTGGFGTSASLRDGDDVYRTYFTTARGVDRLRFDFNLLDLTAFGRQEEWEDSPEGRPQSKPYVWWHMHEYGT